MKKLFIENEEEKTENVNMYALYIIIFLNKKRAKGVNMRVRNV